MTFVLTYFQIIFKSPYTTFYKLKCQIFNLTLGLQICIVSGMKRHESKEQPTKKIRITATPPSNGPIPEEVRRHWVGVEMATIPFADVLARFPNDRAWYETRRSYYHVDFDAAIAGLREARRPAKVIKFWTQLRDGMTPGTLLSFDPNVCVEIN